MEKELNGKRAIERRERGRERCGWQDDAHNETENI